MTPRKCRVYHFGFLIACRWKPRLGLGYAEHTRTLWPRRWTFNWTREWDWSKPSSPTEKRSTERTR